MSKTYFDYPALSNSGIKQILKSPAHFRHWTDTPKADSPAFRMGRALHMYLLQPIKAMHEIKFFHVNKTFSTKAGELFLEQHHDKVCLTAAEGAQVLDMVKSITDNHKIMQLLSTCHREVELYGQRISNFGPIKTKAMLDATNQSSILDIKTTSESARDFKWTAKRYGYDIQAAWYQHMTYTELGNSRDFYFIVVEKNPPYGVMLWQAGDNFIAEGWAKCQEAIEIYGQCMALNKWPSYDTQDIQIL